MIPQINIILKRMPPLEDRHSHFQRKREGERVGYMGDRQSQLQGARDR